MANYTFPWLKEELVDGRYVYSLNGDLEVSHIHLPGSITIGVTGQAGIFLQGADGNIYAAPEQMRVEHAGV